VVSKKLSRATLIVWVASAGGIWPQVNGDCSPLWGATVKSSRVVRSSSVAPTIGMCRFPWLVKLSAPCRIARGRAINVGAQVREVADVARRGSSGVSAVVAGKKTPRDG
jgi:hypothetical protein